MPVSPPWSAAPTSGCSPSWWRTGPVTAGRTPRSGRHAPWSRPPVSPPTGWVWRPYRHCPAPRTASSTALRSARPSTCWRRRRPVGRTGRRPRPWSRSTRTCWPGRTRRADSSFVDLGGDSLSYVELSLHLEERLGAAARRLATAPDPRAGDHRATAATPVRPGRHDDRAARARHPGHRRIAHARGPRAGWGPHPAGGGGLQLRPLRGDRAHRRRDVATGRWHGRADRHPHVRLGRGGRPPGRHLLGGEPGHGQLAVRQRHVVVHVAVVVPRGAGLDPGRVRGPAQHPGGTAGLREGAVRAGRHGWRSSVPGPGSTSSS